VLTINAQSFFIWIDINIEENKCGYIYIFVIDLKLILNSQAITYI